MTSNYPKTPHVAQALVMAETLRELYPRGVPRQAANLLRKQHAEIERLKIERKEDQGVIAVWRGRTLRAEAEIERLRAEILTARDAGYEKGVMDTLLEDKP